jgi:hypothetical protein
MNGKEVIRRLRFAIHLCQSYLIILCYQSILWDKYQVLLYDNQRYCRIEHYDKED